MVEIAPFKAYMYNLQKISRLEDVIAPPYDIIKPEREQKLKKNPFNITHVDLPSSYDAAARILKQWIDEKVLVQPQNESFYVYTIKFFKNSKMHEITGLIALVKPEDFSKKIIFPHEMTFPKCMEDRLKLLKKTRANLCPIYLIYQGKPEIRTIIDKHEKQAPRAEVRDLDGFLHSVKEIQDKNDLDLIKTQFRSIKLVIADGHHRYKTGLIFSKEPDGVKYVLAFLVDFHDPGLLIFPTHRLVKSLKCRNIEEFLIKMSDYFDIQNLESEKLLAEKFEFNENNHEFGMYHGPSKGAYILKLKSNVDPSEIIQGEHSDEWKRLDVTILHEIILKNFLNSNADLEYEKSIQKGMNAVKKGEHEAFFMLPPTKLISIQKITELGELMPHKSTYFHPKPLSGLLIYKQ
ncbi:MAG: DUF1015 domain-containing protein [Candidatus Helarchaeales archaeon]